MSDSHPCATCEHLPELLANPTREWFNRHGWSDSRIADALKRNRSTIYRWLSTGNIPAEGRYDLARLALSIIHGGASHE